MTCRYDREADDYLTDGEPCRRGHCRLCRWVHVSDAGTCPECLAVVRDNIRGIARMCDSLPDEVEHRGVNGEAMMLLGPAADPESIGHVEASIAAGRLPADYLEVATSETHPLFVLGTWDMIVRDALEHDEPAERLTVATAADYLDRQLTYLAGFPYVPFEDMARDVATCKAHLESVLRDGEQVEKAAPCLTCRRPVTRTTIGEGEHHYRCDRCRRDLTANEYRLAVKAAHLAHADRLPVADLAERINVPASTIRRWVATQRVQRIGEPPTEHPPLLHSCGRDDQKRKLYRVADAEGLRDQLRGATA